MTLRFVTLALCAMLSFDVYADELTPEHYRLGVTPGEDDPFGSDDIADALD